MFNRKVNINHSVNIEDKLQLLYGTDHTYCAHAHTTRAAEGVQSHSTGGGVKHVVSGKRSKHKRNMRFHLCAEEVAGDRGHRSILFIQELQ